MVKAIKNKPQFPELLTITEVSKILKCHSNTLRHWDNEGILPAIRIGIKRVRRYKKDDIMKFLKQKE